MKRLIRAVMAGLAAVPLAVFAATSAAAPASAESNGVGLTPAMGWSSWSFIRSHPTAAKIEAQAQAMKSSGLTGVGYQYVNLDDFWYQCPGSQGPNVDQYGRWVIDATKFPASGSVNGIQAVANYVHGLGLKFGVYATPGISKQAVAQNTPIEGTSYTADQIAEPSVSENNYNCGGMVGIDYSKPGAQAFINSWANQFASWGADYVKLDGVGSFDIPDVQAWSDALRQTGRPIHLELSNSLNINDASTWAKYSNGWRTGGDIECYCGTNGSSYPLTDWGNVSSRFDQVAAWQPDGGPGAFNDYNSIEVGNGSNDGLSYDERQTQLSLWALAASPFILGTESFTDNGALPALAVKLAVAVPSGWSATATSLAFFPAVAAGQTVRATFTVVPPQPSGLFSTSTVTGTASYGWPPWPRQTLSVPEQVTTSPPVQAPYLTYSSATDAAAAFGQLGQQFGISGTGADLYTGTDAYSTIYAKGAVGDTATITTEVTSQQNMSGYAKAGIIVRNDMTASGTGTEGGILFESPGGGIQLEWNDNGGTYLDQVSPANGTIPESLPVWLELVRNGSSYTGYYSLDGSDWLTVGSATVPGQAPAQDARMFVTSHAADSPGQVVFNGFATAAGGTPPALATSYEAESASNTLAGGAVVQSCATCSGGAKVGFVGDGGTLTFGDVTVATAGTYRVTIVYCDGSSTGRQATVSANGGPAQTVSFTPTGSFSTVGAATISIPLVAGSNTIEFANPANYAPDFDRIILAATPG